jgi:hypothetical protein
MKGMFLKSERPDGTTVELSNEMRRLELVDRGLGLAIHIF